MMEQLIYKDSSLHSLDSQNIARDSRSQKHVSEDNIGLKWFAMSAPYCRELKAKHALDSIGIRSFIPMRYQIVTPRNSKASRQLKPAVHNLIFVHSSKETVQQVKSQLQFLQYLTRTENGKNIPIIVPDKDMEQFIAVTETYNERLIYLTPDEINLKKGTRVRIIGGQFNGIEGTFLKLKGHRNKRVVIMANDIIGVALEVQPDLIEIITGQTI